MHNRVVTPRVLLIESNPALAARLTGELAAGGMVEVQHVKRLADARALLESGECADCVVVDLETVDAEGLAAIQALRGDHHRLPIVALGHDEDMGIALEALRLGAQEFVLEGVDSAWGLARAVSFAMRRKRMQDFEQLVVGVVGHDLRQPLQTISIGTSLLAGEPALSEGGRATIERMGRAVKHVETLVHDLLDLTRIKFGGQVPVDPEKLDLVAVVVSVVKELRSLYPAREISFEPPEPVHGLWDRGRIEQVLDNLLVNALQHSAAGSRVSISMDADSDCAYLSIHNQGPAIPRHVLPHVFEPLARADDGPAARVGSVGLGLFIADQIVRAHRGEIAVTSSDEAGTTFRVVLPRLLESACEVSGEPLTITAR